MICYLGMGWCIIFTANLFPKLLGVGGTVFLVAGGIIYSLGAILYGLGKNINGCTQYFTYSYY